jgi:NAD(P)-dependent dehydrogenase (short-subunit alcohol dehydrogenase family)
MKQILERFKLDGKSALITGGGQGIGAYLAEVLAQAGANVAIVDVNISNAKSVASSLQKYGRKTIAVECDVRNPKSVKEMVVEVTAAFEGLDIALNNAGINLNSAAEETPVEDWDMTFAVNLRGVFLCCQAEAGAMLPRGYGKIINMASTSSLIVPHPQKQAAYNSSKGG